MYMVTRRSFVTAACAATWVTVRAGGTPPGGGRNGGDSRVPPGSHAAAVERARYLFFDAAEAQFIEAACGRLIVADDPAAAAVGVDVARYVDRQLAGPWGSGATPYRDGAWQPGSPTSASGAARPPAMLFRSALRTINQHLDDRGTPFGGLHAAEQHAVLAALHAGGTDFSRVPGAFFATLLTLTVEGFFSHSPHGAQRDRIAWPMSGFPGAHTATS
jgi:gluconate 2-dehydrogenase gamma chain